MCFQTCETLCIAGLQLVLAWLCVIRHGSYLNFHGILFVSCHDSHKHLIEIFDGLAL